MAGWYTYALLALFLNGTQRFLYKVSAEKGCNTAWTTFSFMATVALLSSTLFFVLGESVPDIRFLLFIALLNSGSFSLATIAHMEALKRIPAGVAYPIIRLNVVLVVIFSFLYFQDDPSVYQGLGLFLAMAVIVLLTRQADEKKTSQRDTKRGLIFVFVSLLGGTVASISSKFAALHTTPMAFIATSYIAGTIFSLGVRKRLQTEEAERNHRDALIIGFVMGLINFAGYYSFLKALSEGPLSIVVSITGMHFVIPIMLSAAVYKERLTPLRVIGISLTIVSIVLLRL